MLFRSEILSRIAQGEVTTAFRKWKRLTVRPGGRLKTKIGEIAIEAVTPVELETISDADARCSGAESKAALKAELSEREGVLYRIDFRFTGPDPRPILARQLLDSEIDLAELNARVNRMDRRSHHGLLTLELLRLIDRLPGAPARKLAKIQNLDILQLKRKTRKLKELGLTESLPQGYQLSPRGRDYLLIVHPSSRPNKQAENADHDTGS